VELRDDFNFGRRMMIHVSLQFLQEDVNSTSFDAALSQLH